MERYLAIHLTIRTKHKLLILWCQQHTDPRIIHTWRDNHKFYVFFLFRSCFNEMRNKKINKKKEEHNKEDKELKKL